LAAAELSDPVHDNPFAHGQLGITRDCNSNAPSSHKRTRSESIPPFQTFLDVGRISKAAGKNKMGDLAAWVLFLETLDLLIDQVEQALNLDVE
jgi:hypothetical protein